MYIIFFVARWPNAARYAYTGIKLEKAPAFHSPSSWVEQSAPLWSSGLGLLRAGSQLARIGGRFRGQAEQEAAGWH